ncbi:hypothetical protein AC578_9927 [Pseudocercospora eumusae]|uniref:Uncharacterized protein n=1 Tax=Pseudocercospora eumusae TaxID=321146 RepID=A0A139HB62_9PEZI|nr:hypothetical protein AC578_9927 [Pseudocercospora eumusae]
MFMLLHFWTTPSICRQNGSFEPIRINPKESTLARTLFAPKAALKKTDPRHYRRPDFEDTHKAAELVLALKWSEKSENFVFFSNSLLFALAVAAYRDSKGESDVHVLCIDAERVRTSAGREEVVFENVASIFTASCHPGIENSDGSLRAYSGVFVATDCIELGRAAWIASYDVLKERGLHALFPRFAPQVDRYGRERKPRLNIVVEDMRAFGFRDMHSLTAGRIDSMMHLASAFRSTNRQRSVFPMHVLAALLAFKKTDPSDVALQCWLRQRCQEVILLDEIGVEQPDEHAALLPETDLQLKMMDTLRNFQLSAASSCAPLSNTEASAERQALATWMQAKYQKRRRERDQNSRKPSRYLHTPPRNRVRRPVERDSRDARAHYRDSHAGSETYQNSSLWRSRPDRVRKMRLASGSSAETAILLEDSSEEDRYSNGRRYGDRPQREQEGTSRKRRRCG